MTTRASNLPACRAHAVTVLTAFSKNSLAITHIASAPSDMHGYAHVRGSSDCYVAPSASKGDEA